MRITHRFAGSRLSNTSATLHRPFHYAKLVPLYLWVSTLSRFVGKQPSLTASLSSFLDPVWCAVRDPQGLHATSGVARDESTDILNEARWMPVTASGTHGLGTLSVFVLTIGKPSRALLSHDAGARSADGSGNEDTLLAQAPKDKSFHSGGQRRDILSIQNIRLRRSGKRADLWTLVGACAGRKSRQV